MSSSSNNLLIGGRWAFDHLEHFRKFTFDAFRLSVKANILDEILLRRENDIS